MAKAKWTTSPRDITESTDVNGTFNASVPLLDNGIKVADMKITITADRIFIFNFVAVQGLTENQTIKDFKAWSNV